VCAQDLPSIVPKKGEVVLEVKAAAVNFPDLLIVQVIFLVGLYTPPGLIYADRRMLISADAGQVPIQG